MRDAPISNNIHIPAPKKELKPSQELKPKPPSKKQLQNMQPQHVKLPGNAYTSQNGATGGGFNGLLQDGYLEPRYCLQMPQYVSQPQDRMSPDLSDAYPFLGTLMGLQSRLNHISRMNDDLGLQCGQNLNGFSHESMDAQKVQLDNPMLDNPRLSEQVIHSHQVHMLSQHIKSLTNQVRKLQAQVTPLDNKSLSTQCGSQLSSTDDSSSNTRSSPPPNREHANVMERIA
jgi:hypothetical protein